MDSMTRYGARDAIERTEAKVDQLLERLATLQTDVSACLKLSDAVAGILEHWVEQGYEPGIYYQDGVWRIHLDDKHRTLCGGNRWAEGPTVKEAIANLMFKIKNKPTSPRDSLPLKGRGRTMRIDKSQLARCLAHDNNQNEECDVGVSTGFPAYDEALGVNRSTF